MQARFHFVTIGILSLTVFSPVFADTSSSVGEVFEVSTGELVYREFHQFTSGERPGQKQSMVSTYKDINGNIIGSRRVEFQDGYASAYSFSQPELGIKKNVIRGVKSITYSGTEGDKSVEKEFTPKAIKTAVVNAGMFNAVERAWAELITGEVVTIDLVVPDRAKAYAMQLKRVNLKDTSIPNSIQGNDTVAFTLSINNRLLRLLVPPVELGYDVPSRQLIYYRGPSNLKKASGDSYKTIEVLYNNDV